MSAHPSTRRIPGLAVAAWLLALGVIAALGVAVARHLSSGATHMHMAGAGDVLSRADGQTPDQPLLGMRLFTAWQLNSLALAVIAIMAALYLTGVALVPSRNPGTRWPLRRTAWFFLGLAACAFATNGSIAVYDQVLFSAHMLGHLTLVMVAPALLVAGHPLALSVAAAPPRRAERLQRVLRGPVMSLLTSPPVALATYTTVIVGSHLTGLMDTIMSNVWAGQIEHVVYLLAGYQFFVLVVGTEPIRWRLSAPARWLLLLVGMAVDTFTGIILMQGTHAVSLMPSGLDVDALSDTRTGGAIMWFGGDAIMAVIMIGLVIGWLRTVELAPTERGWLEQARGATFTAHTGSTEPEAIDDDADDARLAYNAWLARLDR